MSTESEKHIQVNEKKPVLLISPQVDDPNNSDKKFGKEQWTTVVKKNVSKKLNEVPVTKTILTKEGKGFVAFNSIEERDKAEAILADEYQTTAKDIPKNILYPKIKLIDIDYDKYKDATDLLCDDIIKKNA